MIETALYILAGIALYGAVHQLYLGALRTPDHPHVIHGMMYLLLCAFAVSSALTYQAQSVATLIATGKLGVSIGLVLWGALAWFVATYTACRPRLLLAVLTVLWSLLLIGNIGAPYSLLYAEVTPLRQMLPGGGFEFSLQTRLNPWWIVVELLMLASLLFSLYASLRLYRAREKRAALALGSGLLVLLGASVSDALVNAGQIQSAYLGPFGFLVLLVAASVYPTLQPVRKVSPHEEPAANYNLSFHLNQPPLYPNQGDRSAVQAPHAKTADVAIPHTTPAEIVHQGSPPSYAPAPAPVEVAEVQAAETEPSSERPQESEDLAESEAQRDQGKAGQAPPSRLSLDEAALTEVSDNLIDIAVYATMAMNRFKRGGTDTYTLETLCKKVRTQAIKTRRIANRMMHHESDKRGDDTEQGPESD